MAPSFAPSNYTWFDNSTDTYHDNTCSFFNAGDIGKCYCSNTLDDKLSGTGIISMLFALTPMKPDLTGDPHCGQMNYDYVMSIAVLLAAVVITAIINAILKRCIMHLVKLECHVFKEYVQDSMFIKIFVATYVNMAVVVLVAFGSTYKEQTPSYLRMAHVFIGPYREFSPGWYGNVGFYLVLTFLFHSFVPIFGNLIKYYITIPMSHVLVYYQVRGRTSHSVVMQHQLDKDEVGPIFDVTTQSAQMLARLAFAMTFAPGIPLLTLLCCIAFIAHFAADKFFLCWYHEKPVFLTDLVMKRIMSVLPYIAIIRLCVACWMYSASTSAGNVLSASFDSVEGASASAGGYNTNVISLAAYMKFIVNLQSQQLLPKSVDFLYHRITRGNVFPIFILLLFIIAIKFIRKIWYFLPFYWIGKGCKHLLKRALRKEKVKIYSLKGYTHGYELMKKYDPLRTEAAPFTGPYFRYNISKITDESLNLPQIPLPKCLKKSAHAEAMQAIKNGEKQSLKEQLGEDWEEQEINDFPVLVKVWPVTALTTDGSTKMKGDHKRTYEVVRDEGSYSYDLEKIPGYSILILAWKEYTAEPILADYYSRHPDKIPTKPKTKKELAEEKLLEEERKRVEEQAEEDAKPREYKHVKRRKAGAPSVEEEAATKALETARLAEEERLNKTLLGWLFKSSRQKKYLASQVVPDEGQTDHTDDGVENGLSGNPMKLKPSSTSAKTSTANSSTVSPKAAASVVGNNSVVVSTAAVKGGGGGESSSEEESEEEEEEESEEEEEDESEEEEEGSEEEEEEETDDEEEEEEEEEEEN